MVRYRYRAVNDRGEQEEGVVEAPTREAALAQLWSRQLVVTRLTRASLSLAAVAGWQVVPARASLRELSLACRQLSTLLGAGVPIVQGLRVVAGGLPSRSVLREVFQDVARALEGGATLAEALSAHASRLPRGMVGAVEAGETGGFLEEAFRRLAELFERDEAVRQKVRSALAYPAVVLAVSFAVVLIMLAFVVPRFATLYASLHVRLPAMTLALLHLGEFLQQNVGPVLGGALAAVAGTVLLLRHPRVRREWDRVRLRLPLFGDLWRKQGTARMSRTLAALLRSGVPILTALGAAGEVAGSWVLAEELRRAAASVERGGGLAGPLREGGRFPSVLVEMVAVGEETGNLDEMLEKAADFFERETDQAIATLTSALEPAIIVVLGTVVGFILVSVLLPMYSLVQNVGVS